MGNCVGANNYKYFFSFLVLIELFVLYTIFFEIVNLQKVVWADIGVLGGIRLFSIFFGLAVGLLFVLPLR